MSVRTSKLVFLLAVLAGACAAAVVGFPRSPHDDPAVDESLDESFPASDPPPWTSTTAVTGRTDDRSCRDGNA